MKYYDMHEVISEKDIHRYLSEMLDEPVIKLTYKRLRFAEDGGYTESWFTGEVNLTPFQMWVSARFDKNDEITETHGTITVLDEFYKW